MNQSQLLTGRITEINGNIRSILQVYMTWYTFYWILNGTVLAWFFRGSTGGQIPQLLSGLFLILTIPSSISSYMVVHYLQIMIKRADAISKAVLESGPMSTGPAKLYVESMWPAPMLRIGLGINGGATAGLALLWLLLLIYPGLAA